MGIAEVETASKISAASSNSQGRRCQLRLGAPRGPTFAHFVLKLCRGLRRTSPRCRRPFALSAKSFGPFVMLICFYTKYLYIYDGGKRGVSTNLC